MYTLRNGYAFVNWHDEGREIVFYTKLGTLRVNLKAKETVVRAENDKGSIELVTLRLDDTNDDLTILRTAWSLIENWKRTMTAPIVRTKGKFLQVEIPEPI